MTVGTRITRERGGRLEPVVQVPGKSRKYLRTLLNQGTARTSLVPEVSHQAKRQFITLAYNNIIAKDLHLHTQAAKEQSVPRIAQDHLHLHLQCQASALLSYAHTNKHTQPRSIPRPRKPFIQLKFTSTIISSRLERKAIITLDALIVIRNDESQM